MGFEENVTSGTTLQVLPAPQRLFGVPCVAGRSDSKVLAIGGVAQIGLWLLMHFISVGGGEWATQVCSNTHCRCKQKVAGTALRTDDINCHFAVKPAAALYRKTSYKAYGLRCFYTIRVWTCLFQRLCLVCNQFDLEIQFNLVNLACKPYEVNKNQLHMQERGFFLAFLGRRCSWLPLSPDLAGSLVLGPFLTSDLAEPPHCLAEKRVHSLCSSWSEQGLDYYASNNFSRVNRHWPV